MKIIIKKIIDGIIYGINVSINYFNE